MLNSNVKPKILIKSCAYMWCVIGPMGVNKANLKEMKCNNIYVHEANLFKKS